MATNGINYVGSRDFTTCPIWRYDEGDDLYFPVMEGKDLPESERNVSILVECKTNSGHKFMGYIVGISKVFSMALFCAEKTFHINKNIPDLSAEQMMDFLKCVGLSESTTIQDLFPLEYATKIARSEFRDFSGRFEMKFD